MERYIDLSHTLDEDVSVFKNLHPPKIYPLFAHEESRKFYDYSAEFEVTVMEFQTSCGTYIDSPYHRYKGMDDISKISLEQTILKGVVVDVSDKGKSEVIGVDDFPEKEIENKAVLIYTGWDRFWKKPEYHKHPFLSKEAAELFVEKKVRLAGIDTINIDNPADKTRPAHSILLKNNILIVENLCNLGKLRGKSFTFYACPVKVAKAAAFPVRAFAIIDS